MKKLFVVIVLILVSGFVIADNCNSSVNADLTLTSAVNATGNTTCFTITANFVTLDCAGHEVYSNAAGVGVGASNIENLTLKNCVLVNFSNGVALSNVNSSTFYNNTIYNSSSRGFTVAGVTNDLNISSNNVSYSNDHGFYYRNSQSNNLYFYDNLVYASGRFSPTSPAHWSRGFRAQVTESVNLSYSTFYKNNMSYNSAHAFSVNGTNNNFSYNQMNSNDQRLNYDGYGGINAENSAFSIFQYNNCYHESYGIILRGTGSHDIDVSFNTITASKNTPIQSTETDESNILVYNNTIRDSSSGAIWVLGFNANVSYNTVINSTNKHGILYPHYVTTVIDVSRRTGLASHWIAFNSIIGSSGPGELTGINVGANWLNAEGDNTTIFNNTIQDMNSGSGIFIEKGQNLNISYNTISNVNNHSIYVDSNTSNNNSVFHGNHLTSARGVYLSALSSNNTFFNNSFYGGSVFFVNNSNSTNYFNNSAGQGNYYDGIKSLLIFDGDGDGYGDFGADYPYNNSQAKWLGVGADYGPMNAVVPCSMAAMSSSPVDGSSLTVADTVSLVGSCESNATLTNARFWLFNNGVLHQVITNSSEVINASAVSESFTAPIELMSLSWWLECAHHSYNANSTTRTITVTAVGSSGSNPTPTPTATPSVQPTPSPIASPSGYSPGTTTPSPTTSVTPTTQPSVELTTPTTGDYSLKIEVEALISYLEDALASFDGDAAIFESATQKLQSARNAYASGDYALAKQYALETEAKLGLTFSDELKDTYTKDSKNNDSFPITVATLFALGLGAAGYYHFKPKY